MKRCYSSKELPDSSLKYVLESLIPYTDANLKLSFSPNLFFNDLENIDWQRNEHKQRRRYKRSTLRQAYYWAKREKLIVCNEHGVPFLTEEGKQKIKPYRPTKLGKDAYLLVTFDIPEKQRFLRDHFRRLLKEMEFKQIQKSVWKSEYDFREVLENEIKLHSMGEKVNVYEATKIKM